MDIKLFDSELKVMEVLWREGDVPARHIAEAVGLQTGWNVNTTYTMLKRMIAKGAIERRDPRFLCHALVTREQALRELAATFDSPLFSRVVESMVRSLRFGSSLAESLETAAGDARQQFRSRKQEQVAKASVKMMVPTGALMLPAMLLLVLGPVLLELMEGF